MTRVEHIEKAIQDLTPAELDELRRWFVEFDHVLWDAQVAADARAGRLDDLASEALRVHERGETHEM